MFFHFFTLQLLAIRTIVEKNISTKSLPKTLSSQCKDLYFVRDDSRAAETMEICDLHRFSDCLKFVKVLREVLRILGLVYIVTKDFALAACEEENLRELGKTILFTVVPKSFDVVACCKLFEKHLQNLFGKSIYIVREEIFINFVEGDSEAYVFTFNESTWWSWDDERPKPVCIYFIVVSDPDVRSRFERNPLLIATHYCQNISTLSLQRKDKSICDFSGCAGFEMVNNCTVFCCCNSFAVPPTQQEMQFAKELFEILHYVGQHRYMHIPRSVSMFSENSVIWQTIVARVQENPKVFPKLHRLDFKDDVHEQLWNFLHWSQTKCKRKKEHQIDAETGKRLIPGFHLLWKSLEV